MNTLSIPVGIMASISFYVGFYHLLIYGRRRQHREDLTFALLCLATGLYDVFCIGLYNATAVAEGVQWQRAQFIALALLTIAFLWFVSDYTRLKSRIVIYAFSAFFLLAIFIQVVDRSNLTWVVNHPSIKDVLLPFGLEITYYEATFGPFTTVQSLTGLVASTYILLSGIRFYRRGYKRQAGPLLLAIGFMYAAAFNDTAVSNGWYKFAYTIEYGYMAMVLLMAYSLSTTVVEAAAAKEALRESEERFRALVETTSDWVWETDSNGVYTYAGPKVRELLGYESEEIIGKTPFDLMPPDEARRVGATFQEIATGHKVLARLENTARHKDGRLVVLETSGVPFFDANGKLVGYRGIDRDITERKHAEEAVRESEHRFRTLAEASFEGIGLSKQGVLLDANDQLAQMLGYRREELLGTPVTNYVASEHRELVAGYMRNGRQEPYEHLALRKDGTVFPVEIRVRTARIGDADIRITAIRDITERKRAQQQLQQRLNELATVNEISQALAAQLELNALLKLVADKLEQIFDIQGVYISLYDRATNSVHFPYWRSLGHELQVSPLQLSGGLTMAIFQSRQPLLINERYGERFAELRGVRVANLESKRPLAWLGVPMLAGNETIGVISVQNFEHENAFTEADVRLLATIAMNVGIAVQNAQLYTATQQELAERKRAEKQAQRRLNELATVNAVSQVAASQLELNTMLELTGEKLRQILNVHAAYIALYDAPSNQVSFPYWRAGGETIKASPIPYGKGLTSLVIRTREPLMINRNYEQRSAELGVVRRQAWETSQVRTKSWLGVPMQVRNQVIGVISAQNYEQEDAFTDDDVRLWSIIAANVGIAIQNAQLYAAAQQELAERKRIQLEHEKSIAELEIKNAELERFTYTVSHDLKSPLVTIRGFLGFVEKDALAGNMERLKADMARITGATDKMQRLLNELLELAHIGRMMNPPQAVPFETVVGEALELVRGCIQERGVLVTVAPGLPTVYGDRVRLIEVVQNLVDNAAKFMGNQPTPRIEIGQCGVDADGKPILFVRDNGIGIESQYHERIFGLFDKLDARTEGTGVGLALVRRIIEVHGGRIWVESRGADSGATFYFTLPASIS